MKMQVCLTIASLYEKGEQPIVSRIARRKVVTLEEVDARFHPWTWKAFDQDDPNIIGWGNDPQEACIQFLAAWWVDRRKSNEGNLNEGNLISGCET